MQDFDSHAERRAIAMDMHLFERNRRIHEISPTLFRQPNNTPMYVGAFNFETEEKNMTLCMQDFNCQEERAIAIPACTFLRKTGRDS
jgi:hypothetical protein